MTYLLQTMFPDEIMLQNIYDSLQSRVATIIAKYTGYFLMQPCTVFLLSLSTYYPTQGFLIALIGRSSILKLWVVHNKANVWGLNTKV